MSQSLNWFDYVILAIIGLSVLISVWRGFMREVLSLAAWIVAIAVSLAFAEIASAYLANYVTVPSVRLIIAFGGIFVVVLFLGGLVNLLVGRLVQSTGLSGTDRMVGVVFGVLRGVAIVAVLVLLAGFTPLPDDPWWKQSVLVPHIEILAQWLRGFLPSDLPGNLNLS
jgi:membrane protein required for colicin V production